MDDAVRELAKHSKVVVLLDQLDALAELVDQRSGRLNALLDLVKSLHGRPNVHIVCSARTFDFHHDTRLAYLQAKPLELQLPSLEQVDAELRHAGIDASSWPQTLRDLLCVPQQLAVFIELYTGASEDLLITSYQQMLDDLWKKRVATHPEATKRSTLLLALAEYMAHHETLWAPVAAFEEAEKTVCELEGAGVLLLANGGLKVGFRHQTLFEHARARAFARSGGSLTQHVLDRQDGLFVRPTLWAVLRYLRQSAPAAYETELEQLCKADVRSHIRCLLIDFLGQLSEPETHEQLRLKLFLADPKLAGRTLWAIRANPRWFESIDAQHLPSVMSRANEIGWPVGALFRAGVALCAKTLSRIAPHCLASKPCVPLIRMVDLVES